MALRKRSHRSLIPSRRKRRSIVLLLENLENRLVLASQVTVLTQPPPSVVTGDAFGLVASPTNNLGQPDLSYSGTATLSLVSGPPGASFTPVTVTVSNGLAVFDDLSLSKLSSGDDYDFQVTMSGLTTADANPVDVIAATAGVSNYYPLPFDADIRGAILNADLDGSPTSVVTLSISSLPYDITKGELTLFNGASGSKTISIAGQGSSNSIIDAGGTSRVFEVNGDPSLNVAFQSLSILGGLRDGWRPRQYRRGCRRRPADRWRHGDALGRRAREQHRGGCLRV